MGRRARFDARRNVKLRPADAETPDVDSPTGLTVTRWRRHGHDRLLVDDPTGARVGSMDLATGNVTVAVPELANAMATAVARWHVEHAIDPVHVGARGSALTTTGPGVRDPGVPAGEEVPTVVPLDQCWQDLTVNRPGRSARERAEAELARLRERGRWRAVAMRTLRLRTDERASRVGAGGEESVGVRLEKLRRHGWQVLHAIPVAGQDDDIDHLLVGPGGVLTVTTRTHPRARITVSAASIRVNGVQTDDLRSCRGTAASAQRLLTAAVGAPVTVQAALVFVTSRTGSGVTAADQPVDVMAMDRHDVPRVFSYLPRVLGENQVAAIFEQARRSTTWMPRS